MSVPAAVISQAPQFRAGIDLIQLDVSVLDKKTNLPVRGLTQADFTILEDNNPQPMAAFAAVDIPDPPPVPMADGKPVTWLRDVPPDVQTNASAGATTDSRLFVLVIDDAMIPFEPWIMKQAKKAALSVIEKLSPADRMAVVLTAESTHAQDFTSDRAKLLAAVEKMRPGYAQYFFGWNDSKLVSQPIGNVGFQPPTQTDNDIPIREMSFGTLVAAADALMAAPDRRKTLIFISPGIPVNFASASSPRLANGSGLVSYEANKRLVSEMPELFRRMQRANINVYPIDPTGIAGMGPVVGRAIASLGLGGASPVDPLTGQLLFPLGGPLPDDFGHYAANLDLNFLLAAASNTGGRALVNTDDLDTGIQQMFLENGSYYLLGYQAPPTDPPGTLHRLKVVVNRPNVEVRTRSGYYTPKPEKVDATHPPVPALTKAVSALLPSAALPMEVTLVPVATPGRAGALVVIALGLHEPVRTDRLTETVELETRAFSPDGVAAGRQLQTAHIVIAPGSATDIVRYEALSSIALKPGRYQLRLAAHRASDDTTGSVFADVEVPDFASAPLSLSGVVLNATSTPASAPMEVIARLMPFVPTTERAFPTTAQVTAFVRVYQGGTAPLSAVALKVSIIDGRNAVAFALSTRLPPDRFKTDRAADYRLDLPLTRLAPGPHLLTFEAAAAKTTARRDVRLVVK